MFAQSQTRLLMEGAECFGVYLTDKEITCYSLYWEELVRWSRIADLVAQVDPETVIRKHFLDSLALVPLISHKSRLLDLGSGAGFPGLVLAILDSSLDVTLVESRRKRVSFLKEVGRRTKLENVNVYEGRAETLLETISPLHLSFNVVVTRATWSLKEFLVLAAPFLAEGGLALAMKGPGGEGELIELDTNRERLGFTLTGTFRYVLPFGKELRQVFSFTKKSST